MRICKHCGRDIIARGYVDPVEDGFQSSVIWFANGTSVCQFASWHAPYDVPETLDPEVVEHWLQQPLVID